MKADGDDPQTTKSRLCRINHTTNRLGIESVKPVVRNELSWQLRPAARATTICRGSMP